MNNLKAKLKKQGGFTLIEMLIVVAIIAILIAIAIPMVNNALESAREAVDDANERAAIGLAYVDYMQGSADTDGLLAKAADTALYQITDNSGKLVASTTTGLTAYGKGHKDIGAKKDPTDEHEGCVIQVTVQADGSIKASWITAP